MDKDLKKYDRPLEEFSGKLPECPTGGCEFKCCKFDSGNYIVMYPGEMAAEKAKGLDSSHLRVIEEDYLQEGGLRVVCERLCTSADVKPLDCKIYPLWAKGPDEFISGSKCPLPEASVWRHAIITRSYLKRILTERPELTGFFRDTEMVGYEEVKIPDLGPAAMKDFLLNHETEFLELTLKARNSAESVELANQLATERRKVITILEQK